MEGSDLIGTAATGTGKTAAFALPILHHLLENKAHLRFPRALIIAPTRELVEQNHKVIKLLSKYTQIRSVVVYGGIGFNQQERALKDGSLKDFI